MVLLAVESFLLLSEQCHWFAKVSPVVFALVGVGVATLFTLPWIARALFFWFARALPWLAHALSFRWRFRITPDRCVVALLALEAFLLLSGWFRWFPFNQHKGWTVLITVVGVGVALLLMFSWFLAALVSRLRFRLGILALLLLAVVVAGLWFLFNEHKGSTVLIAVVSVDVACMVMFLGFLAALAFRWQFQFSLLSLLLLVVVVAVPCSWLAPELERARKQRGAAEAIEKAGGTVSYDYQLDSSGFQNGSAAPPEPAWLRELLGDDLFVNVVRGDIRASEVNDGRLQHLNALPQLQVLWLFGTGVTDAGLKHLEGLTKLQWLRLDRTNVTDAGLQHLKGLTQLQQLEISSDNIGDAGLQHLRGLTQLQTLDLRGTNVTDAGVKKLQQALANCQIAH